MCRTADRGNIPQTLELRGVKRCPPLWGFPDITGQGFELISAYTYIARTQQWAVFATYLQKANT